MENNKGRIKYELKKAPIDDILAVKKLYTHYSPEGIQQMRQDLKNEYKDLFTVPDDHTTTYNSYVDYDKTFTGNTNMLSCLIRAVGHRLMRKLVDEYYTTNIPQIYSETLKEYKNWEIVKENFFDERGYTNADKLIKKRADYFDEYDKEMKGQEILDIELEKFGKFKKHHYIDVYNSAQNLMRGEEFTIINKIITDEERNLFCTCMVNQYKKYYMKEKELQEKFLDSGANSLFYKVEFYPFMRFDIFLHHKGYTENDLLTDDCMDETVNAIRYGVRSFFHNNPDVDPDDFAGYIPKVRIDFLANLNTIMFFQQGEHLYVDRITLEFGKPNNSELGIFDEPLYHDMFGKDEDMSYAYKHHFEIEVPINPVLIKYNPDTMYVREATTEELNRKESFGKPKPLKKLHILKNLNELREHTPHLKQYGYTGIGKDNAYEDFDLREKDVVRLRTIIPKIVRGHINQDKNLDYELIDF